MSPINQQCRDLIAAIEASFAAAGLDLPVYWGNRNWHPYLADTVAAAGADGVRRAIAFVTSAYGSYSSCRQYLDDIEAGPARPARRPADRQAASVFQPPRLHRAAGRATRAALATLPAAVGIMLSWFSPRTACRWRWRRRAGHAGGLYPAQLTEAARLVAERLAAAEGAIARGGWCTRAAAARRRCPGSARTSAITWPRWPRAARRARCWYRSASSPTTWRSSYDLDVEAARRRPTARPPVRARGHPRHRTRVRPHDHANSWRERREGPAGQRVRRARQLAGCAGFLPERIAAARAAARAPARPGRGAVARADDALTDTARPGRSRRRGGGPDAGRRRLPGRRAARRSPAPSRAPPMWSLRWTGRRRS